MKRLLAVSVFGIVCSATPGFASAASTDPAEDSGSRGVAREPPKAWPGALEGKNSVTPKFGRYTLSARKQNLSVDGDEGCILFCIFGKGFALHGFPLEVQQSSPVVGLEYERRISSGFSLAAELLHTEHRYTASLVDPHTGAFTTNADGDMKISYLFAMIKKYLIVTEGLQLFGGIGGGYTQAGLSGAVDDRASGVALQLVTGVQYRMGRVSLKAEYHYVYAPKISLRANDSAPSTGRISGDLDLGGQGVLVGMSVNF